MMINQVKEKCYDTINELFNKYDDNDYIIQRLQTHIVNYLPTTLETELINHDKRIIRTTYLTNEQNIFIQIFLSNNNYYYLHNNNFFYEYDGQKYLIIKEDDIIHKLLSTISKDKILMQWKYKTKQNILKQIKDRNLFTSIPETDTIQNVLNSLYPSFFVSKNEAKYFLTILGDNILKKNSQLIFLVNPTLKTFLYEIDNVATLSIGINNITSNFITKYHETHLYDNCRLIKINESFHVVMWRELLKKIGLDMICIATHYSNRYENSDKFIENVADVSLKEYTYYIKNTSQLQIIDDFCEKYIHPNDNITDYQISWKNIHFIWKHFLSNNNLQNMIYSNTLKTILKERYLYNSEIDSFCGITSKYLPVYGVFIRFWENTITINNALDYDIEYEVDEIYSLVKSWSNEQITITEDIIIKIIKHFFPLIEIEDNKFVLNITCSLWNKTDDIDNSFEFIKQYLKSTQTLSLISFDDVYNAYYKYCKKNMIIFIVSKRFFEKYLYFKLKDYIVYDRFINIEWLN